MSKAFGVVAAAAAMRYKIILGLVAAGVLATGCGGGSDEKSPATAQTGTAGTTTDPQVVATRLASDLGCPQAQPTPDSGDSGIFSQNIDCQPGGAPSPVGIAVYSSAADQKSDFDYEVNKDYDSLSGMTGIEGPQWTAVTSKEAGDYWTQRLAPLGGKPLTIPVAPNPVEVVKAAGFQPEEGATVGTADGPNGSKRALGSYASANSVDTPESVVVQTYPTNAIRDAHADYQPSDDQHWAILIDRGVVLVQAGTKYDDQGNSSTVYPLSGEAIAEHVGGKLIPRQ